MLPPDATPDEVSQVKNRLTSKLQRRDALRPVMRTLSDVLQAFVTEHAQLSREIDVASASIAPIRKLPLETLSTIFEYCAFNDDEAPLSLLRVCRKWKDAGTCPRVWSRIVIQLEDVWAAEKTSLYLKRSCNSMLHIEFHRPNYLTLIDSGWGAWFEALKHVERWRTLKVCASTFGDINEVLDDLSDFAPNLVHTTFHVEGRFSPTETRQPRLALGSQFCSYPKYHSLQLHAWALPLIHAQHPSTMVFSHLKHLHLTDTYASTFPKNSHFFVHPICANAISAFLGQCTALETFIFDARDSVDRHSGVCCTDPFGNVSPLYTLPALQNIVLMAHHLDAFTILNHLVLPGLRTAHIEPLPRYSNNLSDKFGVAWRQFFHRSNATLLEKLHVFTMDPVDIVWTLERAPQLTTLHLAHCTSPAPVFKALAKRSVVSEDGSPWLCPSLRWLSCAECFSIPWKTVARFFRARHRAHCKDDELPSMVELVLNGHDVFEDRDLDAMANFKVWHIRTLMEP